MTLPSQSQIRWKIIFGEYPKCFFPLSNFPKTRSCSGCNVEHDCMEVFLEWYGRQKKWKLRVQKHLD